MTQKVIASHEGENGGSKTGLAVYMLIVYTVFMIRSFADRETEKV